MPPSLPVIRMRPNKSPQRLRFGHPWAFADELVLDRRSRKLPPGSLVQLEAHDGEVLGLAAFNPDSRIAARMLDRDTGAEVDQAWFATRIARALRLRERLYDTPYYRLIHAEADGLPGIVIDRFGDAVVIQPNAAWADLRFDALCAAVVAVTGVSTIVKNASGRARGLEGLDDISGVVKGALDGPLPVEMNGATYFADLEGGQKTGLFFDQRDNHALAAKLANGARVLDVFSHVGGFALACLAGGAVSAEAVDASDAALSLAERGATASGFSGKFASFKGDAFEILTKLVEEGRRYDVVICDPPAFAPSKPALEAGLRAYERIARLAAPLVETDGFLVLCSCSHAADMNRFRTASLRGVGRAGRAATLIRSGGAGADHPVHPALAESAYLKSLFLRLV